MTPLPTKEGISKLIASIEPPYLITRGKSYKFTLELTKRGRLEQNCRRIQVRGNQRKPIKPTIVSFTLILKKLELNVFKQIGLQLESMLFRT